MPDEEPHGSREKLGDHVIIYKRSNRWWAEFYHEGRQRRKSLDTESKKQARTLAIRLDAELSAGTLRRPRQPKTLKEMVNEYLAYLRSERRAPRTLTRYTAELNRFTDFAEQKHALRLDQVTLALVEQYRAWRSPNIQPKTLYHETVVIKQILNYAVRRDLLDVNPLRNLRIKKVKPRPQPVYTLEQVEQIIAAAEEPWQSIFSVLAFSGLRIGELKFLTWNDADLDGGWLHVRAKDGWKPKSGDDRKLPLNGRLAAALRSIPQTAKWVFVRGGAGGRAARQIDDRAVLSHLKSVLRGIGIAAGKVHTFRHFFISHCANQGVQPLTLMRWVGQSDLQVILGYYHLTDAASAEAMSAVRFTAKSSGGGPNSKQGQNKDNDDGRDAA